MGEGEGCWQRRRNGKFTVSLSPKRVDCDDSHNWEIVCDSSILMRCTVLKCTALNAVQFTRRYCSFAQPVVRKVLRFDS